MQISHTEYSDFFAHTPSKSHPDRWHYLSSHHTSTADLTAGSCTKFGAGGLGRIAGLLHDIGKFNPEFQEYLRLCWKAEKNGIKPPKSKSPHSIYGALMACRSGLEILAFCLEGHHGGMRNLAELKSRLKNPTDNQRRIMSVLENYANYLPKDLPAIPKWAAGSPAACEFLIRMIFSSLVDADWLDTESHFDPEKSGLRGSSCAISNLWSKFEHNQAQMIADNHNSDSAVNLARREIYKACIQSADGPQGVYKLTVPTGGGKTRSGMAFALKHAVKHGLDRVIVAIPYTSIIDQNAEIYRGIFGDENIIEHHSAIDISDTPEGENEAEVRRRLAAENWDAPIIITTTVQLFESLFSNKPSRCRKLHNIARSVLILDEVQTLPTHLLQPILSVLDELIEHYGVTLVLSTATQPAFSGESRYLQGFSSEPLEIVPNPSHYFDILKRVEYEIVPERWSWERVSEEMRKSPQSLCIVNSRKDAIALFGELDSPDAFHLSTLMCPAHRKDVLREIRRRLENDEPCKVASTQVVEAGVDIDFPLVLRASGPLDRIVQAAGRCNREGKLRGFGRVVIFVPEKDGSPQGGYATATAEAKSILDGKDCDLNSPEIFNRYFTRLWQDSNLDVKEIQSNRDRLNYQSVSDLFRMIEDDTIPVVVKYGNSWPAEVINKARYSGCISRDDWRKLQQYTVTIYRHDFERYRKDGMVSEVTVGLYVWEGKYGDCGIAPGLMDPADLIA